MSAPLQLLRSSGKQRAEHVIHDVAQPAPVSEPAVFADIDFFSLHGATVPAHLG